MQNTIQWLINHRRGLIIAVVIFCVIAAITAFFSANAFVNISAKTNLDTKDITVYTSSDAETKKIGAPGLHIVSRATKSLIVSAGEYSKTQSRISIPWYGYADIAIDLARDKNAVKIPFYSTQPDACTTYSQRLESLLQYKCRNTTTLVQYQTPDSGLWKNSAVASGFMFPNQSAKPYAGGILGIADNGVRSTDDEAPSPLAYVADDGKFHYFNAPAGVDSTELGRATLYTNTIDSADKRFVLVTSSGVVYLGAPMGNSDTINYHKFESSHKYTQPQYQTLCEIRNDNAVCYRGEAAYGDTPADASPEIEVISTFSFDGKEISSVRAQKPALLDSFHVTSSGKMYGKYQKKLVTFDVANDKYQTIELSQNIDAIAVTDTAYYTQSGDVYKVDSNTTSHQVFHSPRADIKTLISADNTIIGVGPLRGESTTTLHAYQLQDDDNMNPGSRIIDLLPTAPEKLDGVTYQNLVGDKLVLGLAVANSKKSTNGNATRASEISAQRQKIVEELENIGVDPSKLTLILR